MYKVRYILFCVGFPYEENNISFMETQTIFWWNVLSPFNKINV